MHVAIYNPVSILVRCFFRCFACVCLEVPSEQEGRVLPAATFHFVTPDVSERALEAVSNSSLFWTDGEVVPPDPPDPWSGCPPWGWTWASLART